MLPDVLGEDLLLVICGTAVATHSANIGSYYAGNGNKFWPTLYTVSITDRCLRSQEYRDLMNFGVGLTDLVKKVAGTDDKLGEDDFDNDAFYKKIVQFNPRVVCFNGKKAAEVYLKKNQLRFSGRDHWQHENIRGSVDIRCGHKILGYREVAGTRGLCKAATGKI